MNPQLEQIIINHLCGELSPEEELMLEAWLQEEENKAAFLEIKKKWQSGNGLLWPTNYFDTAQAWNKISTQIEKNTSPSKRIFLTWWKVALPAALLLLALWIWKPTATNTAKTTLQVVAQNDKERVTLPDQSQVILRRGAKLVFEQTNKFRKVVLTGDAHFEVKENAGQPFIISQSQALIRVIGTVFSVSETPKGIHVGVMDGIVEVSIKANPTQHQILKENQQALISTNTITKDTLRFNNNLYWQTQELQFDGQRLSDVLVTISEALQTEIVFAPQVPQLLRDQKITTTFKTQELEDILSELCLISRCNWQKQGNKYLVQAK